MRRPAHGATSRPGPCAPASGYGRALGRPGPSGSLRGSGSGSGSGDVAAADAAEQVLDQILAGDPGQAVISANAAPSPGEPGPVPAI